MQFQPNAVLPTAAAHSILVTGIDLETNEERNVTLQPGDVADYDVLAARAAYDAAAQQRDVAVRSAQAAYDVAVAGAQAAFDTAIAGLDTAAKTAAIAKAAAPVPSPSTPTPEA